MFNVKYFPKGRIMPQLWNANWASNSQKCCQGTFLANVSLHFHFPHSSLLWRQFSVKAIYVENIYNGEKKESVSEWHFIKNFRNTKKFKTNYVFDLCKSWCLFLIYTYYICHLKNTKKKNAKDKTASDAHSPSIYPLLVSLLSHIPDIFGWDGHTSAHKQ